MTIKTMDDPAEAVQIQAAIATDSPAAETEDETVAEANITASTAVPADDSSSPSRTEIDEFDKLCSVCSWICFILTNAFFMYPIIFMWYVEPTALWVPNFCAALIYAYILLTMGLARSCENGLKDSVLTSLYLLLAVMAISVVGLYLPVNAFPRTFRARFLGFLFLSALPSLYAALKIDQVYKTPSMPVAIYGSATWLVVCLILVIDPYFIYNVYGYWYKFWRYIPPFWKWWFVFTAGPWLVLLTLGHSTNRIPRARLLWASSFATLLYTVGMFTLFNVVSLGDFWRWAVMTVLVVPPLFFMSLVTRQRFVMIVAGIVLMIDAWRLADYLAYDVGGWDYWSGNRVSYVLTQVGVLVASGILLAVIGYWVSKRQARIESAVSKWAKLHLSRWVIPSEDGDGTEAAPEDVEGGNPNAGA